MAPIVYATVLKEQTFFVLRIATVLSSFAAGAVANAQDLHERLLAEGPRLLAAAAQKHGDAERGAIVFHQAALACARCHDHDADPPTNPTPLGPDLTAIDPGVKAEDLIESILFPSKTIKKGFETVVAELIDGRTAAGLLVKKTEIELVLRNPGDGALVSLPLHDVETHRTSATSIMPADLADQLASRQQFLDLVRYLLEVRDGGRERARELRPPESLTALKLPEYESRVDHASLIRDWNNRAFQRGKAIYERLCVNCHGTHDGPGSLPTSLRFASERFKNGSDPHSMYQTLTRGYGLMTPQTWMVPRQKYDVIHYLREAYLRGSNPSQYFTVSEEYLNGLPKGDTRGPLPQRTEPWSSMDYGPSLIGTYEIGGDGTNIAQKGIAIRLDPGAGGIARGKAWMIFEHDTLRMAAAWTGEGFVDWQGIHFDGRHNAHPHVVGDVIAANPTGSGWANPATDKFDDDARVLGRDGRRYGPLPRSWGRFRGLYHHGSQVVVSYTVGETPVLESPGIAYVNRPSGEKPAESDNSAASKGVDPSANATHDLPVVTRLIQTGRRPSDLLLLVATHAERDVQLEPVGSAVWLGGVDTLDAIVAGIQGRDHGCVWVLQGNRLCLRIPAGDKPLQLPIWFTHQPAGWTPGAIANAIPALTQHDISQPLDGGARRWPQTLTTEVARGKADGPFAVDVLTHPQTNPWLAQFRPTGLDFFPDGDRAVICAWDGDVWLVRGLNQLDSSGEHQPDALPAQLSWQRIASGLFQPLGIKIVDGAIYVTCRDQLVILRDLNGDAETDFYECFNSDHQVTEHFHEFAMGLQVDEQGNFYYAKSARHALASIVPHHGTLLRISADGSRTDILANGFRAANGVCLNPDGTFVVTDQEGHWNPKNRINWVREGGFYGNMFGYHDVTDSSDEAMEKPLCWITNSFDRSPAELLWAPRDSWGPLGGSLLNLSYGYGKLFVVPFEEIDGQKQGGMCALPIDALPTGVMRGRFHPRDRQLYACGMFAWAGSATQPGGVYRIRYTGQPAHLPVALNAREGELAITFTDRLDPAAASAAANYTIKTWSLKRSANYGSPHIDERPLTVAAALVSDDHRTVTLKLPNLRPTWGMEIVCRLKSENGQPIERVVHNSIYHLAKAPRSAGDPPHGLNTNVP